MTTAAQDEFNNLIRDKDHETRHPEDRLDDSDLSEPESPGAADDYLEKVDTDDELDLPANMRANYYMPSLRSEANTGPKGVIADAQAYEQAKKQAKRFTFKRNPSPAQYEVKVWHDDKALSDEDSEDSFMKEWRAARLKELQNVGQRIRSRTNSPTRRIYGTMPWVDAKKCHDAMLKTPKDTTFIVYLCRDNDDFPPSRDRRALQNLNDQLETCMPQVAQRNDTVRFVKMSGDEMDMANVTLPAVYAYKGDEVVSGWDDILADFLGKDGEFSSNEVTAVSIETGFRKNRIF